MEQKNTIIDTGEVDLKGLVLTALSKWYLFVITVAVALVIAALYIASTPPVYKATSILIIKQDRKAGSSGLEAASSSFSNMGSLFAQQTNVYNEILAFDSPSIMQEVVRRLDLRADYKTRHNLYMSTLYGNSLPVTVNMIDFPETASFDLVLNYVDDSSVQLSKMHTQSLGGRKVAFEEPIVVPLKDTVDTPVGRMCIMPNIAFYDLETFPPIIMTYTTLLSAAARYSGNFHVELTDKESTAITLSQNDNSPQRANNVLSAVIAVYNDKWISDRNRIAVSTSEFINSRLQVIEKELGNVDSNISSFKSKNQLLDPQMAGTMYMNQASKIEMDILSLNSNLEMAKFVREHMATNAHSNKLLPANSGIGSMSIESQISEYNSTVLQRNALVENSSEQSPVVLKLDYNLQSMHSAIMTSIDTYITTLKKQIQALEHSAKVNASKISASPIQAEYLTDIERQQKVKESLYLFLLQKREENELSQAFTAYNTRLLMDPVASGAPIFPRRQRILLIALLIGAALPFAGLYLQEALNTKVRSRKDLAHMSVPFIGEIPYAYSRRFSLIPTEAPEENVILVQPHSRNMVNEAFRVVRSNLDFILAKDQCNVIQCISFNVGSGKSFVSANLAATVALKGQKVCAVDLDLRKATLSKYVKSSKKGISDYLSGKVEDLDSLFIHETGINGLDILPVGTIPPNPTELLYSARFESLIAQLRERYDLVLLDSPPAEVVADSTIINKCVDRTIFVIRTGLLDRDLLPEIDGYYESNKFKGLIMLLNGTDTEVRYSYARYGYGRYGYASKQYYGYTPKE